MSWKPQVQVAGEGEKWLDNALRFATKEEAETSARDLARRWIMVTNHRAGESFDPINYMIRDDKLVALRQVGMRDLKHGDLVVVDGGSVTCHPGGVSRIEYDKVGISFSCEAGHHYFDESDVNSDNKLIGIYKPVEQSEIEQSERSAK
jgi:hypothetical protein